MLYLVVILGILLLIEAFYKKLPHLTLRKVDVDRQIHPSRVVAGEEAVIQTTICNRKIIPMPWIRLQTTVPWQFAFKDAKTVQIRKDEACEHVVTTSLLFYEKLMRKDYFIATKRGYYTIDRCIFQSGDLFGWVDTEMTVNSPMRLWVHPPVNPLHKMISDTKSLFGEVSVRRWIVPDPIFATGARDYTERDPFSSIDWKATARVNRLQVKQHDFTADRAVQIFLDTQSHSVFWKHMRKEAVEKSIEIAASVIHEAMHIKAPTGLVVNNLALDGSRFMNVTMGLSSNHRNVLMDTLAMATPYRTESMSKIMSVMCKNLASHTVIVLITSYLSDELMYVTNRLAKTGYSIKLINLSEENAKNSLHLNVKSYSPLDVIDQTVTELPKETLDA